MTMRARIHDGKLFTDYCEGMEEDRMKAKKLMKAYNETDPEDVKGRERLLEEIMGKPVKAWVEPPFYFCYGSNISIGEGSYLNFNCNFIDDGKITIGEKVMFGAGSVVTKDIPENSVAVGNPCRVVREISEKDWKYYYKDREITKEDLEEERKLCRQ